MKTHHTIRRSLFLLLIMVPVSLLLSCSKEDEAKSTPPVVTTSSVLQITTMTAVGGGTVTSEGGSAVVARGVCWGTTVNPTLSGASSTDGSTGTGSFTASVHGLTSGAVYHIRAYATNSEGTSYGEDKTFVSSSESFTTVTLSPDILDTTNVRLVGSVYPNNSSVAVTFEYGLTESYGNSITALESPVSGNTDAIVTAEIGGLQPGVIYHYRVRSEYMLGGIEYGHDETFSPNGAEPEAVSVEVTDIISVSATVHGTVNANYLSTMVSVEYGPSVSYGFEQSILQNPVTGQTAVNVMAQLQGLEPLATYHYRIRAENSLGTSFSEDATFATQYVLGEHYFGGIIFYLDETGQHGMVCAEQNQGLHNWAMEAYTITGATATDIGDGMANTNMIVAAFGEGDYAARICYDLVLNGYDDWFLPSQNEIAVMRPYLDGSYNWSSSEINNELAWINYFNDYHYFIQGYKNGPWYVRAARAF